MIKLSEIIGDDAMYGKETNGINITDWSFPKIHDLYHDKIMNGESIDTDIVKILYGNYVCYFNRIVYNCEYLYKRCVYLYILGKYGYPYELGTLYYTKLDLYDALISDGEESIKIIVNHLKSKQNELYRYVLINESCSEDDRIGEVIREHRDELENNIPEELTIDYIIKEIRLEV